MPTTSTTPHPQSAGTVPSTGAPATRRNAKAAPFLIEESPLIVLPSLAQAVGLSEAIVLQQLHYLLTNPANGKLIGGRRWIFNTATQWVESYFPFWCDRTLRQTFRSLEARGYVRACQPEGRVSRRKYYTLDYEALARALAQVADETKSVTSKRQSLLDGNRQPLPNRKGQNLPNGNVRNLPLPSAKTSTKITAESSAKNPVQTNKNEHLDAPPVPAREALAEVSFSGGDDDVEDEEAAVPESASVARPRAGDPFVTPPEVRPLAASMAGVLEGLALAVEGREPEEDDRHAAGGTATATPTPMPMPMPTAAPRTVPDGARLRPTDVEWARFMSARHPELVPNPGWEWCQSFHAECHAWLRAARAGGEEEARTVRGDESIAA